MDDHTHPVINLDEKIGKEVGRRTAPRQPLESASRLQEVGAELYRSRDFGVCKRGVYRFHTHEEANAWMMQSTILRALRAERN